MGYAPMDNMDHRDRAVVIEEQLQRAAMILADLSADYLEWPEDKRPSMHTAAALLPFQVEDSARYNSARWVWDYGRIEAYIRIVQDSVADALQETRRIANGPPCKAKQGEAEA